MMRLVVGVLLSCLACAGGIAPGEFDAPSGAPAPTPAPRLGWMATAAAAEQADPHLPVVSSPAATADAGAPAPAPPRPVLEPVLRADAGALASDAGPLVGDAGSLAPAPSEPPVVADAAPPLSPLGGPCLTDADCADDGACWVPNAGGPGFTCHPSRASGWLPHDCIPTDPCRYP